MENKTLGMVVRVLGYAIVVAEMYNEEKTAEHLKRKLLEIVKNEGREFESKY